MKIVTNSMVEAKVRKMQEDGIDVSLSKAYGKLAVENGAQNRTMSPRLPTRQLLDWLDAYERGWRDSRGIK